MAYDIEPQEVLPAIGEVLEGRYVLESCISRGGMGAVFRAFDQRSGGRVAIKFALPHVLDGAERTFREADILAEVSETPDSGIPSLLDFGVLGDSAYFVMELVTGDDLETYLSRHHRVAPKRAVEIAVSAAYTLANVHSKHIVHRDVKPANLVMTESGEVSLLDFGIACPFTPEGGEADVTGSPRYMSPEQIAGRAVDHRSDIWSLGVTLYELLVGAPPFNRPTLTGIMSAMLTDRIVPPSELVPEVSPELDEIVLRCLAMDPSHRYDDAMSLVADLLSLEHLSTQVDESPCDSGVMRIGAVVPAPVESAVAFVESTLRSNEGEPARVGADATLEEVGSKTTAFPLLSLTKEASVAA